MTLAPIQDPPIAFVPVVDTWYTAQPAPHDRATRSHRGERDTPMPPSAGPPQQLELRFQLQRSRIAAGMSQGDLARGAGVPLRTIKNIEHGGQKFPPDATLTRLSSVLGTTLSSA